MEEEKLTLEALARMINRGFDGTATKEDVQHLEDRLDQMENTLVRAIENRVEIVEDDVRVIKTHLRIR